MGMEEANELTVERRIAAPPDLVWRVMTERMPEWFCPAPWRAEVVEQDWRPGGRSAMTFHGPDGETFPQEGVFLEVVPGRRFVSDDAYAAGWVPRDPFMTGIWEIEPDGDGTRYRGTARHWTTEALEKHRAMGFEQGWGAAADQLKAMCEGETK
jgi:uncharacterized protein YndB with AHSA1/START domain